MPNTKRMCPKCGSTGIHNDGGFPGWWLCIICGLQGLPTKQICQTCGKEIIIVRGANVCLGGCPGNKEKIAATMKDEEPAKARGKKKGKKKETEE